MYSVRIQKLLYKTVLKYYCGFYRFHYVPVLAGDTVYLLIRKASYYYCYFVVFYAVYVSYQFSKYHFLLVFPCLANVKVTFPVTVCFLTK